MIRAFDVAYFMVSVDTPEDNKAFAEKEHADFPILSDPDKTIANAYGVIPPDRPPDRQFASRWTFYIDPQGQDCRDRQGGEAGHRRRSDRREARPSSASRRRKRLAEIALRPLQRCAQDYDPCARRSLRSMPRLSAEDPGMDRTLR